MPRFEKKGKATVGVVQQLLLSSCAAAQCPPPCLFGCLSVGVRFLYFRLGPQRCVEKGAQILTNAPKQGPKAPKLGPKSVKKGQKWVHNGQDEAQIARTGPGDRLFSVLGGSPGEKLVQNGGQNLQKTMEKRIKNQGDFGGRFGD